MRTWEPLYWQCRAIDIVYRINDRGRRVMRYLEKRWRR